MNSFRRWLCYIVPSLIFLLAIAANAQDNIEYGKKFLPLYLGISHQEVLSHLPPGAEFYGDYKGVVKAQVDRETKTLRFSPVRPGLATLSVHDRKGIKLFEYRLDVRKTQLTKVVREVRGLLSDIEGISIKIVNNKVVIDGMVLLPKDLNRIYGVIGQFNGQVASLVEINPFAQQKIAEIIERDINNPDIEVRAVNGKFILQGVANSEPERARAEIIAKTYVPPPVINAAEAANVVKKRKELVVINLLQVRPPQANPPAKIIQLIVHYVELSKKYLRSSSFRWAPGLQDETNIRFQQDGRSNNSGIVTEITGVVNNLLPQLNWAKQHGFARILKSTSVVVQNNKKGVIVSETRVPFLVRQPNNGGNTTQFARVGVNSEITPRVTNPRSDMIELGMLFKVSTLTGASGTAGPQIANNEVRTTVSVRSGQSAAVGGLITNDALTEFNKDPSDGAIINLYSSKDFQKNRSQFVVFVTPIIKSSASAGSEKIKRKFRLRE